MGKKIDFLIQEMNREANTIGSKSNDTEITSWMLDLKAEIEKIRGVSCEHAVSKLVEYRLVTELGRMDAPGRPMLFGTTEEFLRSFGITSLEDLPMLNPVQVEEFKIEAQEEVDESLREEVGI